MHSIRTLPHRTTQACIAFIELFHITRKYSGNNSSLTSSHSCMISALVTHTPVFCTLSAVAASSANHTMRLSVIQSTREFVAFLSRVHDAMPSHPACQQRCKSAPMKCAVSGTPTHISKTFSFTMSPLRFKNNLDRDVACQVTVTGLPGKGLGQFRSALILAAVMHATFQLSFLLRST